METIIVTIISSGCVLLASVITTLVSARSSRIRSELERDYVIKEINELKERVDTHNNYAVEIPLIEKDIQYIKEKLK